MIAFGLEEKQISLMRDVFTRYPAVTRVKVFGSRAKGNYRPESDVDFALYGDIDAREARRIAEELDELPLPFKFDVQVYERIQHADLRAHIDRAAKDFFVREPKV